MKKYLLVLLILSLWSNESYAQKTNINSNSLTTTDTAISTENIPDKEAESKRRLLILPFPFYNDTIGTGVGIAAIAEGYVQKQMIAIGAALVSDNESGYGFLKIKNLQLPWIKRVFLEPEFFAGEFGTIDIYLDGNPDFTDETSGNNDSSKDNFIEAEGTDIFFESKIKFLLPIGNGKDHLIPKYKFEDGILTAGATGGEQWNPFRGGRTYFETTPFYREQNANSEDDSANRDEKFLQRTAGIELALIYDNTDFLPNPSSGSYQEFSITRDWGGLDSSNSWTVWKIDLQKYFSLGASASARQRVIALNFWTVDTPTWDSYNREDGDKKFHRPPTYKGANLGGLWRLRGYPATRFHDQAAIYYGAEYRHIPNWNPLKDITLGNRLNVDWLQLVGFVELGRVAPAWNIETLHEDMKWNAGAGIRVLANNVIVRIDLAGSEEEALAQVFIGHPF